MLGRVGQPPVQLDHHAIWLVNAIPAPASATRSGERHLAIWLRQPSERAGHPAANIIEGRRGLGKVEHRLFDLSPRRIGVAIDGQESTS